MPATTICPEVLMKNHHCAATSPVKADLIKFMADMVVLSRDILNIPPETIRDTEILYTIAKGKIVFGGK